VAWHSSLPAAHSGVGETRAVAKKRRFLAWHQSPYTPACLPPLEDAGTAGILLSTGTLSTAEPGWSIAPPRPSRWPSVRGRTGDGGGGNAGQQEDDPCCDA